MGKRGRAVALVAAAACIGGTCSVIGSPEAVASVAGDSAGIIVRGGTLSDVTVTSNPTGVSMQPAFSAATNDYALRSCAGAALTFTLTGSGLQVGTQSGASISVPVKLVAGQAVIVATTSSQYWFRCLPNDFPPITVASHGQTAPGWYVTATIRNGNAPAPAGFYAMVLNDQGTPVWYMPTNPAAVDFQLLDGSTFSSAQPEYFPYRNFNLYRYDTQTLSIVRSAPTPHWSGAGPAMDVHELLRLSNGNFMFITSPSTTDNSATFTDATGAVHANVNIVDCVVEETTPSGQLVWSWDAYYDQHISPSETFLGVTTLHNAYDVYHCNSLDLDPTVADPSQADVLISMRNTDAIYRLQRSGGTVLWKLGNDHTSGSALIAAQTTGADHEPLLASTYLNGENTIGGQHDARFHNGAGSVSFYDNHTGQPAAIGGPRGLQVDVVNNGVTHTERETSEYTAPDSKTVSNATGDYRPDPAANNGAGDNVVGWGFRNALALSEFNNAGADLKDIYFNTSATATIASGKYYLAYRVLKLPLTAFNPGLLRQSSGLPRAARATTALGWNSPGELTLPSQFGSDGAITGSGVSAASPGNAWVDAFWRGGDGNLWHASSIDGGISYSGPWPLGAGPLGGSPQAVSSKPGRVDVLWRGTDDNLRDYRYTSGIGWSGPLQLGRGGSMAGDPFPVTLGPGRVDVFWKGADGSLWHAPYSDSSGWHAPLSLGIPSLGSDPHPVSPGYGRVDVFWRGTDGNLWHVPYSDTSGWQSPQSLGGGPLGSDPRAVSPAGGAVDVFWQGSDNGLWHDTYSDGAGWSGPHSLGAAGRVTAPPVPVSPVTNTINVFWRDTDPQSGSRFLSGARYTPKTGWSVGPAISTASLTVDPSPVQTAPGQLAVFAESLDGDFWFQTTAAAAPAHVWAIAGSPDQGTASNELSGVACMSDSDCWAVGTAGSAPLIEQYAGSGWSVSASPSVAGSLKGVTCVTAADCWTVGADSAATPAQPLIEQYDGTAWAVVATPALSAGGTLNSVTCVSSADCWAAGSQSNGTRTLLEHYDGTGWTIAASPDPGQASSLASVTCVNAGRCLAVGRAGNGTLIERYDGSSWLIDAGRNRGTTPVLWGVSCGGATECWAAGANTDSSQLTETLVEHYNASGWAVGISPNAGGPSANNTLRGVTCMSSGQCWAAGWYTNGTADQTLIEGNTGTGWTFVSSPNGGSASALSGVACPLATDCWAVGYSVNGGIDQTLIERYS